MAEADAEIAGAEPQPLGLDPFGFLPGVASRIAGLGGSAPSHDPTYVFHTPYVAVAEGPAHFSVRFTGLSARRGTLVIRVHMVADEPGAHARLVNSARVQLNRLIALNGETYIRFEGYRGVRFALYGSIADQTDAQADGVFVSLDRPALAEAPEAVAAEARESDYGRDGIRPDTHLISTDRPRFALPVSQAGTRPQLDEPAYRAWAERLKLSGSADRSAWSRAYALHALDSYGLLRPGARGLGFQHGGQIFARVAGGSGAEITLAELPRPGEALPRELVNFDFLWSIDAATLTGSVRESGRFVEAAFACLRPGGYAVHVLPYDPSVGWQNAAVADHACFNRGDIERLALALISRGHEVAQVKIDATDAIVGPARGMRMPTAPFAIIARKAPLAG